jgi:hypothetical protein
MVRVAGRQVMQVVLRGRTMWKHVAPRVTVVPGTTSPCAS